MPPTTTIARVRRATLAVKREPIGQYATNQFGGAPVGADLLPVENVLIEEIRGFYPWAAQSGLLDALPGVQGELMVRLSGEIRLRGRGSAYAAGNKPEAAPLFVATGASETIDATVGAEKATYKWPKAPDHESLSIVWMQENAPSLTILGARGNGAFVLAAGKPVVFRWELMGIHGGRGTQALVTQQPSATPVHPILASAAFQVGAENYAAQFRDLAIALNNQVSPIAGPNDARAYAGFFITRDPTRAMTLEFDPEAVTAATFDWFSKWDAGTLVDWNFQTTGAQYARLKFGEATNGKAQIVSQRWGSRDELRTSPTVLNLLPNAGEDSLVVTYD